MGIAFVIGSVVAPIFLGIAYFAIITPVALLTRAFGRDELQLRRPGTATMWRKKPEQVNEQKSYERQF